jgi:hypothetical protein
MARTLATCDTSLLLGKDGPRLESFRTAIAVTARFVFASALLTVVLTGGNCFAGAWTLEKHHWQTFNATTLSTARAIFGSRARGSRAVKFRKILAQNTFEYGLNDKVTLFATPAYVSVLSGPLPGKATRATGSSLEVGARILLFGRMGKLSLQSSYKAAGPFDLSDSSNQSAARQVEVRLLYGTSFKFGGDDGFFDFQAAQRWISRGRPDESVFDVTAGLWLRKDTMVMAQSFNVISSGNARPPFAYYRSHKVELSLVERISRHWSLQLGGYLSPAGQNALVEKGLSLVLWTQD